MFGKSKEQQALRKAEAERLATNFEQYFKAKWSGVFEKPEYKQEWQIEFSDQVVLAVRIAIFRAAEIE